MKNTGTVIGRSVYFPIRDRRHAALLPGNELLPPLPSSRVEFKFLIFDDDTAIYECTMPGCSGCGCPSFKPVGMEIPRGILEHLTQHVELCEGVDRMFAKS